MSNEKQPNFGNGKICYIVMPATDIDEAARFYQTVFNWTIRKRDNGETTFDDGVNEVSGVWVTGLPLHKATGLSIHLMVDDMDVTLQDIVANGGKIVTPVGKDAPEITASFSDPSGNIFGLYQHRG